MVVVALRRIVIIRGARWLRRFDQGVSALLLHSPPYSLQTRIPFGTPCQCPERIVPIARLPPPQQTSFSLSKQGREDGEAGRRGSRGGGVDMERREDDGAGTDGGAGDWGYMGEGRRMRGWGRG